MKIQKHFICLIPLLFTACASTPQTHALLSDPGALPAHHEISNVPFIQQTENSCGPATLAMLALWSGLQTTADELAPTMITTGKKGTLQTDYLGAARRLGLLAVTVTSLQDLLIEISHDHPIVVLQNLGSSANPLWHYAIVHGYHLRDETLTLHSGEYQNLKMDLSQFERTWKDGGDWALVVTPPDQLPETASVQDLLFATSALERVGKNQEANVAYQTILKKWPDNVGALFGLGNTYASLQKYSLAAEVFKKLLKLNPDNGAIKNNLNDVNQKLKKMRKTKMKKPRS